MLSEADYQEAVRRYKNMRGIPEWQIPRLSLGKNKVPSHPNGLRARSGDTKGTKTVSIAHHLRRTWDGYAARDSRKLYFIAASASVRPDGQ